MYTGLIALDMDGTLLNPKGQLSQANQDVIVQLLQKGFYITLATGRVHRSAAHFADLLSLGTALISHQGALMTGHGGEKWYEQLLTNDFAQDVLEYSSQFNVQRGLFFDNDLVVIESGGEQLYSDLTHFNRTPPQMVNKLTTVLPTSYVTKVMFTGEEAELDHLYHRLQADFVGQAHFVYMEKRYVEVLHQRASKGQALRMLAERLGINREQVIAVGDEANDIDMLRFAGKSAAMGNAPDEVKQHAKYVTRSNEEDGVAHFLSRFL